MLFAQTTPQQHLPHYLHDQLNNDHLREHLLQQQQQQFQPPQLQDLDLDDDRAASLSVSSSPNSTQPFSPAAGVAFQASPLSTFRTIPAAAASAPCSAAGLSSLDSRDFDFDQTDFDYPMLGTADLMMQSEPWLPHNNQLGLGRSLGRISSHHRESSLSSLGSTSAGPASPFSQNTSNPHIAVTDAAGDGYTTMSSYYEDPSFQMVKSATAAAAAAGAPGSDGSFYHPGSHAAYAPQPDALAMQTGAYGGLLAAHRQKAAGAATTASDRGLLPPPDLSMGSSNRSQPVSVASSIASDSPATPSLDQPDDDLRRRNAAFNAPPKLDRTMTDVYNDELYSPSFGAVATSAPSAAAQMAPSHSQDMFSQRLQAINNQHLSVAAHSSPVSSGASRERSPFRNGSPLAMAPSHDFGASPTAASNMRYGSMPQQRAQPQQQQQQQQQQQRQADSQIFRSQMARAQDNSQTISPKDAVLEYREPSTTTEGDAANFSLFAQSNPQMSHPYSDPSAVAAVVASSGPSNFNYLAPQLQIPQQYPFIAQHQPNAAVATHAQASRHSPVSMVRPGMSPSTRHPTQPMTSVVNAHRPMAVNADGGTYTCTYHGCTLRFETPAQLQKHKREGHRQINTLAARKADSAVAMSLMTSQAGPHRCERINPSTGKPCNTVFSRPYDLTRHEDTIHNARKQKVRCNLCTEEKTFSRADALTRHFRVCHPDVEFPGKHRKRGVHN